MITKKKFNIPFLVYRINSEEAEELAIKICKFLKDKVDNIYVENIQKINDSIILEEKKYEKKNNFIKEFSIKDENSNLCIIVGGDGTCLWANKLYGNKERPPFFCFYKGNLGFLSLYNPENYQSSLGELYKGRDYSVINRALIQCKIREESKEVAKKEEKNDIYNLTFNGLNEITIEKNDCMVDMDIFLNDEFLTNIKSNGLIFSTPTGSTAYCLSSGGPILHNNIDGIVLTAICPFTLSLRPIVLPRNYIIKIKNKKSFSKPLVRYDGIKICELKDNQYVEVSQSNISLNFIFLNNYLNKTTNSLWITKINKSLEWNHFFAKKSGIL